MVEFFHITLPKPFEDERSGVRKGDRPEVMETVWHCTVAVVYCRRARVIFHVAISGLRLRRGLSLLGRLRQCAYAFHTVILAAVFISGRAVEPHVASAEVLLAALPITDVQTAFHEDGFEGAGAAVWTGGSWRETDLVEPQDCVALRLPRRLLWARDLILGAWR